MEVKGRSCAVAAFKSDGASLKIEKEASFYIEPFITAFEERLKKAEMFVHRLNMESENRMMTISGNIVKIDEGNRMLRYIAMFMGSAIFECAACLRFDNGDEIEFKIKEIGVIGVLGGNSEAMLLGCAKRAGSKLAGKVIKAIRKH